jgi:selenide,water dikinase
LLALNLVGWNTEALPTDLLGDVLEGGLEVARHEGFVIAGGHTVDDPEPKYGLAVVGEVDPARLLTNAGLRPGDALVLTKPLGIGIVTTAIKRDGCPPELEAAAIASMTRSNAVAARVAATAGATGATDVTGFGLLGHLGRMAIESAVDVVITTGAVPVLPGAAELAAAGFVPGGSQRNLAHVADRLDRDAVGDDVVLLLADAQTSGGLVFGVDPELAHGVVSELRSSGHDAAVVGSVVAGSGRLRLTA